MGYIQNRKDQISGMTDHFFLSRVPPFFRNIKIKNQMITLDELKELYAYGLYSLVELVEE